MAQAAVRGGRGGAAVTVAALGTACVAFAFQQTAVLPAIPTIQHAMHASREWSAWLVSSYLVASSVTTPLIGKLADRSGKRRLLVIALVAFFVGSIGSALAPSLGVLIGFRALQGVGGAIFPLSLAIVREELAPERVAAGIGALTGTFGLGTALGFGISGLIVQTLGWRWVFAAGAVLVAAATVPIPLIVSRSRERSETSIDVTGGLLLTGGLAVLLVAITEGQPRGWTSPAIVGGFVLAAALLVAWIVYDLRIDEPLLDLRVLGRRTVLLTNLASLGLGFALFATYFLVPYLVEGSSGHGYGFGVGALGAGLYLLPAALGQLATGPVAGAVGRRLSAKWLFAGGLLLVTGGTAGLAGAHDTSWLIVVWTLMVGAGTGLAIGVASVLITQTAPEHETGIATALNAVLRRVGGGIGGQIAAALLAALALGGAAGPADRSFTISFAMCAAVALVGAGLAGAIREPRAA